MSNKKRISKRVKSIQSNIYYNKFRLASKLLASYISSCIALKRFSETITSGESNNHRYLILRMKELRRQENPDLQEINEITEKLNKIYTYARAIDRQGSNYESAVSSYIGTNNYIGL